ncbi:MAG: ThuA domain-containing protein [Planctomycetales bacterium]|nr:ThuA domain-containing protein [Planctomycetales bacterium]
MTRSLVFFALAWLLVTSGTINIAHIHAADPKPLRVLLVLGGCCHDYAVQQELLVAGLSARAHVKVDVAYDPDKTTGHLNPVYEKANWADNYDVVIHDECSSQIKDLALIDRILEPHRKGLPAVLLHCGMHSYRSEGYPDITPWFEFTGLQSTGHGPQQPIEISYLPDTGAITEGLSGWKTINEELYNNSAGKLLDSATPLARGKQLVNRRGEESVAESVVIWTNNYRDTARVFATTLGHNNDTVADDRYLDLITRGLLWSCDKLNDEYLKK